MGGGVKKLPENRGKSHRFYAVELQFYIRY
jgi:hypothetical protein